MSWLFVQETGEILQDWNHVAYGYSGFGDGKNNPSMQEVHETGPIPVGFYDIGQPFDSKDHGPFVLPLTPHADNQMFGRSGFLMHGDSIPNPGTASKGCIIASKMTRLKVSGSRDTLLQVIARIEAPPDTDGANSGCDG